MDPLFAFLSGVGVSLVAALAANVLTRQRERRRIVDERRFEIYMKLLELHSQYLWFTTAELHGNQVSPEVRQKSRDLAWQIADMLRSADEVDYLEEILDVTLGSSFATAGERYAAIDRLLGRLGQRVNPRYQKKIREISEAGLKAFANGVRSNAPGNTSSF